MNDIEQKARELANEVLNERGMAGRSCIDRDIYAHEALCRAIEQHEAFRQEVSDAVANWKDMSDFSSFETMLKLAEQDLFGFIIPAPKPDPMVEVMKDLSWDEETAAEEWANDLRAALDARGLEIREKGQ